MTPSQPEPPNASDRRPGAADTVRNLPPKTLPTPPRRPGVLVAAGEARIRALLHVLLRDRGFAVFLADRGAEAVQLYTAGPDRIDVVLLDLALPDHNAPQVLDGLRRVNPQVRCCLLSADPKACDAKLLRQLGAARFFAQPLDPEQIARSLLAVALDLAEPEAPARRSPDHERREFARRSCRVRAYCQPGSGTLEGLWWQATVLDASPAGVRLSLGRRFSPGAVLALQLPGEAHTPGLSLSARVVHAAGEGTSWVAGCALVECGLTEDELRSLPGAETVAVGERGA